MSQITEEEMYVRSFRTLMEQWTKDEKRKVNLDARDKDTIN